MKLWWVGILGVLLMCAMQMEAFAQVEPCKPRRQKVNFVNNGDDIPVGDTAVQVITEDDSRCQVFIENNGAFPMRCLPAAQGAPTASKGYLFTAGKSAIFTTAGREAWFCIRTSSNTTATTIEEQQ